MPPLPFPRCRRSVHPSPHLSLVHPPLLQQPAYLLRTQLPSQISQTPVLFAPNSIQRQCEFHPDFSLGPGLAACQKGMSSGFTTATALVHEPMEARNEGRLLNLQRQLARLKLLIIDELGFVPLSTTGAELLFEVFSQPYERGSILVTTDLPFDEWTQVFGSERLTGSLPTQSIRRHVPLS